MSEIVLVAGPPGGGKSTYVQRFLDAGYARINRDEVGGNLGSTSQSYSLLRLAFAQGTKNFILDNLYATKESRAVIIAEAQKLGIPIRILWLDTTAEQAQFFAARRQIQRYGHLLKPEEYYQYRNDPNMFPPAAQFAYWKRVQQPELAEGFSDVEHIPVTITLDPKVYVNKAVIFDFDGTLRETISGAIYPKDPSDIRILPGRKEKLATLKQEGWLLLGASNQSGISKAPTDPKYVSETNAIRCFDATCRMLGTSIDYLYASDPSGVPQSYWRKPMSGMGVIFIEKYHLNPAACIFVGDLKTDATFAKRCGFQFQMAPDFFPA